MMEYEQFNSQKQICRLTTFFRFLVFFFKTGKTPMALTFEVNGHGAPALCHYNFTRIKGWNMNDVTTQEQTRLHFVDKHHFPDF